MSVQIDARQVNYKSLLQGGYTKIHEGASALAKQVMRVVTKEQLKQTVVDGHEFHSVVHTYPKQPLWSLYTPIVSAANFFLPKTLQRTTKKVPTWLKSFFVFKVTKKQLVSEVATVALFLSAIALVPDEYKVECSVLLMGLLPKHIHHEKKQSSCDQQSVPMLV